MSLAAQLRPHRIPVNTFRIDVPVASEGFVAALPDVDHSDWEPPEVAAEGIRWVLEQPPDGHRPPVRHGPPARRGGDHGEPLVAPPHPGGLHGDRLAPRRPPPARRLTKARHPSDTLPRCRRDSQRSRVYRAETPLPGRRFRELDQCAAYADAVVGSLWWQVRFPHLGLGAVPRLRPGHGARQAFYRVDPDGPTITLPRRYRTAAVVLHELAHWALDDQPDLPNHGRTFTRLMLDATLEFGGDERAAELRERVRRREGPHRQAAPARARRRLALRLGRTPPPRPRPGAARRAHRRSAGHRRVRGVGALRQRAGAPHERPRRARRHPRRLRRPPRLQRCLRLAS